MSSSKKTKPLGYWKNKEGLEKAKKEVLETKKKLGKTPTLKEVSGGINKAIQSGYWDEFGITSWLDLLAVLGLESSASDRIKWKGEDGLIQAKKKYIEISKQIKKRPTIKHVSGINKAIKRGVWESFGINDWEDFVIFCGFKPEAKKGTWVGKQGLENAINKLEFFYEENSRIPTQQDVPAGIIDHAMKGSWKEFGIESWNDLLKYCGFEVHIEHGKWRGEEGLIRAKNLILEYFRKHNKNPTTETKGFKSLSKCANTGYWEEFEIGNWVDLIRFCGLEPTKYPSLWRDEEGLKKAKREILDFYEEHDKIPRKQNVSGGIINACLNEYWKEFGIESWNDLLKHCGMEPTFESGKWRGEEGLAKAKELIIQYYEQYGKIPIKTSFPSGIAAATHRGYWKKYGIKSWNDLLRYCGLEPTYEHGKWVGKKGVKRARKIILQMFKTTGNVPTYNDVSGGIHNHITAGNWEKYGVFSWNDLLRYCNLEPHNIWGKWVGKEGLERAKKEVLLKNKELGKVPTRNDVSGGIEGAALDGQWVEFGVNNWNDLLRFSNLEPSHVIGTWVGKEGLERAKQALMEIYQFEGKTPTRGEVTSGIQKAIERREWKDFGFSGNTWNEFVIFCGLKPNIGYHGDAWLKWENWCEKAVFNIYGEKFKTKPCLPNRKFPDFVVKSKRNLTLIIDAKLSTHTEGIKKDMKNYIDFCEKLEFWCLFGQRTSRTYKGKEVLFIKPEKILERVKNKDTRNELGKEVRSLYEYSRNIFNEIYKDKKIRDEYQRTLDYWLGNK